MNKPRLLLFDIETSPNVSYTWFGKWEQNVIEFLEEGYILSFAYKWLGEKRVKAYSLADFKGNKKCLVEKLHEVFNEADVVIGHNAKQFDIKWANRAFVLYGLTPPSPYKVIDTLTEARTKFKFNSNRLNDLGCYLGIGCKVETGGFPLWKRCMAGDKKAFQVMVKYNKNDVILLEEVYLKLRPFMTSHPNIANENGYICPLCGSREVIKQGFKRLADGNHIKQQYQCSSCGKWSTSQEKIKIKTEKLT